VVLRDFGLYPRMVGTRSTRTMKRVVGRARPVIGVPRIETRLIRWARSTFRPVTGRAGASDLAFLAMDTGPVPSQIAALLVLDPDPGFDLAYAERLIAERVPAIPRLRQRLVHVPPGCGRPIWVDDGDFDIRRHIREVPCRDPGDEAALLDTAVGVIVEPLPRSRPLWSVAFITGVHRDRIAAVVVLHHVLADGVGGLAVLASLLDQAPSPPTPDFPRRPPTAGRLAADAFLDRLRAVSRARTTWRNLRTSLATGGGLAPARAAPCSLVQRTGPRRRLGVVRTDLATLRAAAHRHGGTVNDAVLTAVAGALHRVLASRGESVDTVAVAVPVAGRRSTTATQLGNLVAPLLVPVPATGDPAQRLRQIAAAVRAGKKSATGPPPIAVLGPVFKGRGRPRRLPLVHEPSASATHPRQPRARPGTTRHIRRRQGRPGHPRRGRRGRQPHRLLRSPLLRRHPHHHRRRRPRPLPGPARPDRWTTGRTRAARPHPIGG
jgi:WS/DGAT/MGAT family acyltransferase